jgi:hypothetical protein
MKVAGKSALQAKVMRAVIGKPWQPLRGQEHLTRTIYLSCPLLHHLGAVAGGEAGAVADGAPVLVPVQS